MTWLIAFIVSALLMGGLDYLWLTNAYEPLYRRYLGSILAARPDMKAAVAFYVIYLVGVMIFAVRPALESGDWKKAALYGALFGFFAYATYDLTNQATLKVWSLKVTLIDLAWGTFLTAVTASAGAWAALKMAK